MKRAHIAGVMVVGAALLAGGGAVGQQGAPAGAEPPPAWNTLPRLCGKLVYRHVKPVKGNLMKESFKGIGKAWLRLYRREPGVGCCQELAQVTEARSGRGGGFSFTVKDGRYWLVAQAGGHEYRMPVEQKRSDAPFLCADHSFAIGDDGKFELMKTVHVD